MMFRRLTRRQFKVCCEIEAIDYIWVLLLQVSRDPLIEIMFGIILRYPPHIVITLISHTTNIIGNIIPASADIRMIIINVLSIKCSIKSFIFSCPYVLFHIFPALLTERLGRTCQYLIWLAKTL